MVPSRRNLILAWFVFFACSAFAEAQTIKVVTTLPTLKALVEEVGGDRVDVVALSRGDQDPHFVTPTPVLMRRTREADLFIENGFTLEQWADEVVNGSGNSKIFRGTSGRVTAAEGIAALEIPSILSREMGDIHPQGNPHVWLDPLRAKIEATNIADALKRVDPENAGYYESRKESFHGRIDEALFGEELLNLWEFPNLHDWRGPDNSTSFSNRTSSAANHCWQRQGAGSPRPVRSTERRFTSSTRCGFTSPNSSGWNCQGRSKKDPGFRPGRSRRGR